MTTFKLRRVISACLMAAIQLNLSIDAFAYVQTDPTKHGETSHLTPEGTETEIEIVEISPVIVLKGQINGTPANIFFDTGAWPNIIGTHMESVLLGPVESVGTDVTYNLCDWRNLKAGHFMSANQGKIWLTDLAPMKESVGIRIDAVAGTPFSLGRIVEIDFENRKFRIPDNPTTSYEFSKKLEFDKTGSPIVELRIGNTESRFLVDTGFNGFLSVNEALASSLKQDGLARVDGEIIAQVYSKGFITDKQELLSLESQEIFDYEFRALPLAVSSGETNKIGLAVLKAFHVSLDLKRGELRLSKNGFYSLSDGCTVAPK